MGFAISADNRQGVDQDGAEMPINPERQLDRQALAKDEGLVMAMAAGGAEADYVHGNSPHRNPKEKNLAPSST